MAVTGNLDNHALSLEPIIGTDKKNPVFQVYRDSDSDGGKIYLYYGLELLEVIPDDRDHPRFKLMIAQLYNAKVKQTTLTEVFGYDRKTMQNWGEALLSGDPERLIRVLEGRGAGRKLTTEVKAFAKFRFEAIYPDNKATYSKQIRREIEEVFGISISSEALRPIFNDLKARMQETADESTPEPGADAADSTGTEDETGPDPANPDPVGNLNHAGAADQTGPSEPLKKT
jgi:hypothetical protein